MHAFTIPQNLILAILELYRVCFEGALIVEANVSLLSRLACKLGFSEEYELSAIQKNIISGGVDNTNVPNYVYRWTERGNQINEIISTRS